MSNFLFNPLKFWASLPRIYFQPSFPFGFRAAPVFIQCYFLFFIFIAPWRRETEKQKKEPEDQAEQQCYQFGTFLVHMAPNLWGEKGPIWSLPSSRTATAGCVTDTGGRRENKGCHRFRGGLKLEKSRKGVSKKMTCHSIRLENTSKSQNHKA